MRRLPILTLASLLALPAAAQPPAPIRPDPETLMGRLRPLYAQPTSFTPAAMRHPLRRDAGAELDRAREELVEKPADLTLRARVARLADAAEDASAEEHWRVALALAETQLKRQPRDPGLLDLQVEAMLGADVATRVVPAAEKLAASNGASWRHHVMLGDAYLRRADFTWRVLVRRGRGTAPLPEAEKQQLNVDLAACDRAYTRAVELAPAEMTPRAARITLVLARPLMATFLPRGTLSVPDRADTGWVRAELLDLVRRNPGAVEPLWHAAHFLAAEGTASGAQEGLEQSLAGARAEGDAELFLEEARGLYRIARGAWPAARAHLEGALRLAPERRFAADWLALADAHCGEPRAAVLERVRARLALRERPQDLVLLGILSSEDQRAEAVEALRKALRMDVENGSARYNLALLLLRADRGSTEARHHLRRLLENRPDDREGHFMTAVIEALEANWAECRSLLSGLLAQPDLDPSLKLRAEQTLKELPPAPAPPSR